MKNFAITILVICLLLLILFVVCNRLQRKRLSNSVHHVKLEDKYAEFKLDGDDLDDPPILVEVIYDDLGEIISITPVHTYKDYIGIDKQMSSYISQQRFFRTCKINPNGGLSEFKKYTYYKRKDEN